MPHTTDKRSFDIGIDEVTINPEFLKPDGNCKHEFQRGSVVYFVSRHGNRYFVDYGLVYDNFDDGICLQLLETRDRRLVNGIPYKEFPDCTEWRKLPMGYSFADPLGQLCSRSFDSERPTDKVDITTPESILSAYECGALVKVQDVDHTVLVADIDYRYGYRLRKTGGGYFGNSHYGCAAMKPVNYHHFTRNEYISLVDCQLFATYEEAKARVDWFEEMIERQKSMREIDWTESQIRLDVDNWAGLYDKTDDEKQKALDTIFALDDWSEIETRVCYGGLEYKRLQNKKWIHYDG